ncbi:MAG TPA: DUF3365 domain-containing protein, partial [Candidatus Methylomirabilis sp.]|nr:DUF3365 domain-containing protein [Candidatus Methylomirabilis sp.]
MAGSDVGADRRRWKLGTLLYLSIGIAYLAVAGVVVATLHFEGRTEALQDAETRARLLLDRNMAIHTYFSTVLKPSVFRITDEHLGKEYFDPTWMSSTYAVREIDKIYKTLSPLDYYYKECAVNARSPENEADPYERAFIDWLGRDPKLQYRTGTRVIDGKPFFYVLRRGERMEGGCLRCHSTPAEAPGDLVRRYGPVRSFHRNVGDPVSAISIRVPLAAAYAQVNRETARLSALLLAILAALFGALAVANRNLFVSPVTALCGKARQIAADEAHLGEMVPVSGGKEMAELMDVFNTMSLSLALHREQLEARVAERTRELSEANRSLSREIEERKRAEEAQGRLGMAVEQAAGRERAMEEQLRQSQKMEAVGRLAGGVAHDFNNLLTVINGYSDYLLSSLPEADPSRGKLREIHKAGERAAALTQQLLAYGRKQMLRPRMVDLNAVVDGSVGMLRRLLGEDVEMVFRPGESLRRVRVDQGQVEQILMNLAANARDALPRGGRLVVETRNAGPDDLAGCAESGGAADPWV